MGTIPTTGASRQKFRHPLPAEMQGAPGLRRLGAMEVRLPKFGATTPPAAFYRYSPDRKAEHARALLAGCRGSLHADGYAGFANLYKPEPETGVRRLTEVACWAHRRSKIYDVFVETGSPAACEALERIAQLFAVEADIRGRSPAERREAR